MEYIALDSHKRHSFASVESEDGARRTEARVEQAALKFVLSHDAVSTVIPGIRSAAQAQANTAVSDIAEMPEALLAKLRRHNWLGAFWYEGKRSVNRRASLGL